MKRTRWRLMVACLAVIGAAIAVAGGSAGNRDGVGTLQAVPGPGAVTYGENIAYTATFDNTSGAVFTQVKYQMAAPVATFQGNQYPAEFVTASCPVVISGGVVSCEFGQLRPEEVPERLTMVWKAPTIPSQTGCPSCLAASGTWLIKEGKPTNPSAETFPVGPVAAQLLGGEGTQETLSAGGYELTACAAGGSSLKTNQAVSESNPVATSFCLPAFATSGTDIGLATTITEQQGNAHTSTVCIAALGQNCGGNYVPADFGPSVVTFVFTVADAALPNGYKITQVFHNGQLLPMCGTPEAATSAEGCVVEIIPPKGTPKIWTIIAQSETNGPWNW
jgi:hypothetical protein